MHGHRGAMGRTSGEVGKRRDGEEVGCYWARGKGGEWRGENEQLLNAIKVVVTLRYHRA